MNDENFRVILNALMEIREEITQIKTSVSYLEAREGTKNPRIDHRTTKYHRELAESILRDTQMLGQGVIQAARKFMRATKLPLSYCYTIIKGMNCQHNIIPNGHGNSPN